MPKDLDERIEFIGTFRHFSNSTYCVMFVEHVSSSPKNSVMVPAMIEVNDPKLISRIKEIQRGQILSMIIRRKIGSTGVDLAAELCAFEIHTSTNEDKKDLQE